ncbi:MAG: T9SS type A sorting domain-containing protein [Bacteroidota bacterium]
MKILFVILLLSEVIVAQNKLPFASQNNVIELAVKNSSSVDTKNVVVEVVNAPEWLKFTSLKTFISNLESNTAQTANFTFSVDKSAPVNRQEEVTFTISNANGEKWSKILSLQIAPPEKYELFQNFPNPFNPTTTISYQLPVTTGVSLKVFDILGKEVVTLDEGVKEAGYHQQIWSASNMASGMYLYQLTFKNLKGEVEHYRKKLLVLK